MAVFALVLLLAACFSAHECPSIIVMGKVKCDTSFIDTEKVTVGVYRKSAVPNKRDVNVGMLVPKTDGSFQLNATYDSSWRFTKDGSGPSIYLAVRYSCPSAFDRLVSFRHIYSRKEDGGVYDYGERHIDCCECPLRSEPCLSAYQYPSPIVVKGKVKCNTSFLDTEKVTVSVYRISVIRNEGNVNLGTTVPEIDGSFQLNITYGISWRITVDGSDRWIYLAVRYSCPSSFDRLVSLRYNFTTDGDVYDFGQWHIDSCDCMRHEGGELAWR